MLVEHSEPAMREVLARRLQEHGYRVVTCAGPGGTDPAVVCPMLRDAVCPAVDGADAVVFALDPGRPTTARIVDGITSARPALPVLNDPALHLMAPRAGDAASHRFYRTTIAPLVRRLYDALLLNRTS